VELVGYKSDGSRTSLKSCLWSNIKTS